MKNEKNGSPDTNNGIDWIKLKKKKVSCGPSNYIDNKVLGIKSSTYSSHQSKGKWILKKNEQQCTRHDQRNTRKNETVTKQKKKANR